MKKFIFAVSILTSTYAQACSECIYDMCAIMCSHECSCRHQINGLTAEDKAYLDGIRMALQKMNFYHPETRLTVHQYESIYKSKRQEWDNGE